MLIQLLISLFWLFSIEPATALQQGRYEEILSSLPPKALCSVIVQYAGAGSAVYEKNSSMSLKPASNMKIITTASALFLLGKDFKAFSFIAVDRKKITGGTLKDNIYFKGKGMASLNENDFYSFAEKLKSEGIRRIEGNLVFDNSYFQQTAPSKKISLSSSPLNLPAVSAISFGRNIISVDGNKRNGYKVSPRADFISIKEGKQYGISESSAGYNIYLSPNFSGSIIFYIEKPALFTSMLLKQALESKGITVPGKCVEGKCPGELFRIEAEEPIQSFLNKANKESDNFYAEILRRISNTEFRERYKQDFSVSDYIKLFGAGTTGMKAADGSGISMHNRISAKLIAEILNIIYGRKEIYPLFLNSLAEVGTEGTLKERFGSSAIKGNFRGKSGWLSGIYSISGYMKTKKGNTVIIALIFNDSEKDAGFYNKIEEKILEEIYHKQ